MQKGIIARDWMVEAYGEDIINKLDSLNCDPTNRVGYNGACQSDNFTEWNASLTAENGDILTAYYYTTNAEDKKIADNDGDGSSIDWYIAGYERN